jgi:hypothetical protein
MSGAAATSPIVDRVTRIIDPCPLFTALIRFQNHKLVFNCEHRHRPASLMLLLPLRFDRGRRECLWASLPKKSGGQPTEDVKFAPS